jgi:hypothetical protein
MRIPALFFFPDSVYLAAKWWHRLALVIFWMWLIWAMAFAMHALWDIWEGFEYARYRRDVGEYSDLYDDPYERAYREIIEGVAYLLSVFVPVIVYRVLLFVGVGNACSGSFFRLGRRLSGQALIRGRVGGRADVREGSRSAGSGHSKTCD